MKIIQKCLYQKIIIFLLTLCLVCSCVLVNSNAYALTNIDLESVPVYTLTNDGKLVEDNNIDKEALYNMLNEPNEDIQPFQIPPPDSGGSIKITPIKNSTIYRAEEIGNVILVLGTFLSGTKVFIAATKKLLGDSLWKKVVAALAADRVKAFITSKIKNAYSTSYMYKCWSSYYGCYILYYAEAVYKDSARKQLSHFVHCEVGREYSVGIK